MHSPEQHPSHSPCISQLTAVWKSMSAWITFADVGESGWDSHLLLADSFEFKFHSSLLKPKISSNLNQKHVFHHDSVSYYDIWEQKVTTINRKFEDTDKSHLCYMLWFFTFIFSYFSSSNSRCIVVISVLKCQWYKIVSIMENIFDRGCLKFGVWGM